MNRAPLVLDIRDLWPAAAVSLGQISSNAALRFSESVEQWLYREAATVTTVTRPFCEHIDCYRPDGPRSVLIPNGTLDFFLEDADRSARGLLGVSDDDFLVTFAGMHGIAQGLPAVLDSAQFLNGRAHLAFVGDGPMKEQLVGDAARRGLDNVSFHDQVPLEQMPAIFAASDALLVPLSAHPTFSQFVPSKMIDSMASGRPVLLSAAGESARILRTAGAGIAIPPENPPALAEAVTWLETNPDEAREMGRRGRRFARKRMRSIQAERLEHVLLDVTRNR
jgi:glycosyltransferase involved in cell wall biosynthesis